MPKKVKKFLSKVVSITLIFSITFSSIFSFPIRVEAEELIPGKIKNDTQKIRVKPTTSTTNNQILVNLSTDDIVFLHGLEKTAPTSGCSTGFYKATYGQYTGYVCAAGVVIDGSDVYLRPWTSPKKAIIGGAIYINGSYIAQGQYTIYLKKFNVNPNSNYSMYSHQYQTNIAAPSNESAKTYKAYANNNFLDLPFTFTIPVFNNMEATYNRPGGNKTTVPRQDTVTDTAFETKLSQAGFPDSYKPYLRALHSKHPNWTFEALQTNENFGDALTYENGASAIQGGNQYYLIENGNPIQAGNDKGWYIPNRETLAYYMDPRNFLNEEYIFQFESLRYNASHTESMIQSIIKGSFMDGISILDTQSYASIFIEAGKTSGVSAVYLAALALQESGMGGGAATTGKSFEYKGINYSGLYNYYNLGASSGAETPYKAGLVFASGGACTICSNSSSGSTSIPVTLTTKLASVGLKSGAGLVKGFSVGESISTLKAKLQNQVTINSQTDKIGTGTTFTYNGETYTAVVYGDLNGDGTINSADLLKMRQHLIGTSSLSGAYLEASKLVNSNINSADLLRLRQYLLGTQSISQG